MDVKLASGHFWGQVMRKREEAGCILTETRYEPGAAAPRHCHERGYFCLVRRGSYTEAYGNQVRQCEPLTLAFHPAGEVHSERFHDLPTRSFNVEIGHEWMRRRAAAVPVLETAIVFRGGPVSSIALRLYGEFLENDDASSLAIEGLILELIAAASRREAAPVRSPGWLVQARELVEDRFREPLGLSEVASTVGVHPAHLAASFRKHQRCTIGEYVRRLRVEYACREMRSSRPLAQIALAAGFSDQSHFTRTFRRMVGVSPSQYRRGVGCLHPPRTV